ncbi:Glycosyl transferase family 2 [Sulfurivirga caldicuralii]|uniref:Glycosyl transferase family 2 n=1 Tax=Sulfurivirga caldicuralii TaxID=364032 RepID=A0A1N6DZD4_9GAMM|nr:glycosyltransferase family 2 protein [Sulfurivirga caldicuralii]SIN76111.1 Glycosyl transferase family 2 [Sulfurivirga caldicuralii]
MHILTYYWRQLKPPENPRLVMTILCRNEVDVIEANIRVHALLGVDAFVVMDNGSTDGTREKLGALQGEFDLTIIDQPSQTYQQAKWMLQLAHVARLEKGAHWVISNDADEFWIPQQGDNLKMHLRLDDSVVTVPRSNMILTNEALKEGYRFFHANHRVQYPICYERDAQKRDPNISMLLVPISPKVIVNPNGLIKISGGNHRAKHWDNWRTARTTEAIRVYHYPIRSYEQFEANIRHRQQLLKNTNARMGDHYRRWVGLYEQGRLREEFERIVISAAHLNVLSRYKVVVEDTLPRQWFEKIRELQ